MTELNNFIKRPQVSWRTLSIMTVLTCPLPGYFRHVPRSENKRRDIRHTAENPSLGDFMTLGKRSAAEFIGTFWLVFGGCGSAVLAAAFPGLGIGFVGVALAFGLTVLTMAYAIGHISGCHLNPAVSAGLVAGGRFPASELLPYVAAQLLGACSGAGVLYLIASGKPGFDLSAGFACNGYAAHSPGGYNLVACML